MRADYAALNLLPLKGLMSCFMSVPVNLRKRILLSR